MSDQGLRDALERLAKSWFRIDCRVDLPENAQWGEGVAQGYANAAADLLRTVREHPAEPVGVSDEAVAITDEMRKAGFEALAADGHWHKPDSGGVWRANYTRAVDLVLEAVWPLLGTRPQPTLDRRAVHAAIVDELDGEGVVSYGLAPKLTDRVMDAVHPLPTREQIAEALHHDNHPLGSPRCRQFLNGRLTSCYEDRMYDARAVLALMGGAE